MLIRTNLKTTHHLVVHRRPLAFLLPKPLHLSILRLSSGSPAPMMPPKTEEGKVTIFDIAEAPLSDILKVSFEDERPETALWWGKSATIALVRE